MADALRNLVRESVAIAVNDHVANNLMDELNQINVPVTVEVTEIDAKSREQMIRVHADNAGPRYFSVKVREVL